MQTNGQVTNFIKKHFLHFNAASLVDSAEAYKQLIDNKGKMFLSMAGAMSTAELGKSLAEMIRQNKVHAICCTGANLEEDLFNLVAHNHYKRIKNWRNLTPKDEQALLDGHYNRITDTCIPEEEAMRRVEREITIEWKKAAEEKITLPPHQFLFKAMEHKTLQDCYQIDTKDSWLIAAKEKNIPIFTPGWEDSTLGNFLAASIISGRISSSNVVENGIQLMQRLVKWYKETSKDSSIGFFQIGGGIAGDFPICAVPLIRKDLREDVPLWSYFCQISDSTTSYGSYSGAIPSEKITWEKISVDTPSFIIESDATIVAPLIFAYLLGW